MAFSVLTGKLFQRKAVGTADTISIDSLQSEDGGLAGQFATHGKDIGIDITDEVMIDAKVINISGILSGTPRLATETTSLLPKTSADIGLSGAIAMAILNFKLSTMEKIIKEKQYISIFNSYIKNSETFLTGNFHWVKATNKAMATFTLSMKQVNIIDTVAITTSGKLLKNTAGSKKPRTSLGLIVKKAV